MKKDSPHWITLGPAATAAEQAALNKLRDLLPDDGITTAWANLTFTDSTGGFNEVDVLLLTKSGLFVLELKGWHGNVLITPNEWHQNGKHMGNPPVLNNTKAKRLSGLLGTVGGKAGTTGKVVPFVRSIMVLHGANSVVHVQGTVNGITTLNGYSVSLKGDGMPLSKFLAAPPDHPGDTVTPERAKKIHALIAAAGLKPTPKTRKVADYDLDSADPLGGDAEWADFLATHPTTKARHRIRVFKVPPGAAKESAAEIERHAVREYRLTAGISHPGITRPLLYVDSTVGPALVFDYNEQDVPLDTYLDQHAATLSLDDRVALVRRIAEVLKAAHSRRVMHRALSPQRVTVRATKKGLSVAVRDWFAGQRISEGSALSRTMHGTTDIPEAIAEAQWGYLAPEVVRYQGEPSPISLDVYGLGALTYRIFTGKDPADSGKALHELYASASALDPLVVAPELPDVFAQVVREATQFDEAMRPTDISVFLASLEAAHELYADREHTGPVKADIDPLDAAAGDIIDDRFEIKGRRGSGTTGVALLVDDYLTGREDVILKLARDDAAASRLAMEAEVLKGLDHPRVVRLLDDALPVGGRAALLLSDAGAETLSARLQTEGRSTIEQLENYGRDLLDAVRYLDEKGVFHRDIKPANLAIAPDPGTRKPRLTLFDLSLAREPLTHIQSGSRPYLDPYLDRAGRRQYDRAAELFSVAATLFEMAAGVPPWWQAGNAPERLDDAPVVQATMFEDSIADALESFFQRALAPDLTDRFANLDEFAAAWQGIFAPLDAEQHDDGATELLDELAAAATLDTPLAEAGLTARARSAASRLRVQTVGELLGVPPMRINQVRGLGEAHRKELQRRVREWRSRLQPATPSAQIAPVGRMSVEQHREKLFPSTTTATNQKQVAVLRILLGDDPSTSGAAWPTLTSIADQLGLQVSAVSRIVTEAVDRWRQGRRLREVTADVTRIVNDLGRIATLDEVATQLLVEYGSALSGEERMRHARGLVRAVVELDASAAEPELDKRRPRDDRAPVILATGGANVPGRSDAPTTEQLLALGRQLGDDIDKLLTTTDVASASLARQRLRRLLPDVVELKDARLLELAVHASTTGRLSTLDEVYRRDLPAERAVELALTGVAVRELTLDSIDRRARGRFRSIAAIPSRPGLDGVVKLTHPHLEWKVDVYRPRETTMHSGSTRSTALQGSLPNDALARTLAGSVQERGALVLTSSWSTYDRAAATLASRFGAEVVDLAAIAVEVLHSTAAELGADWDVVVRADAPSAGSGDQKNLHELAKRAFSATWVRLESDSRPLLFTNPAVLAHLGLVDLIARTIDLSTARAGARWFLLPHVSAKPVPDLDGSPMPFGAGRWIELPTALATALPHAPIQIKKATP